MSSATRLQKRSLRGRVWGFLRRRPTEDTDLVFLSRKDVHALLDRRARRELGMSADEFLARADRGELEDSAAVQHLLLIAGERPR